MGLRSFMALYMFAVAWGVATRLNITKPGFPVAFAYPSAMETQ